MAARSRAAPEVSDASTPSGGPIVSWGRGLVARMPSVRVPRTYQTLVSRCGETVVTGPLRGFTSWGIR